MLLVVKSNIRTIDYAVDGLIFCERNQYILEGLKIFRIFRSFAFLFFFVLFYSTTMVIFIYMKWLSYIFLSMDMNFIFLFCLCWLLMIWISWFMLCKSPCGESITKIRLVLKLSPRHTLLLVIPLPWGPYPTLT